MTKRLKYEKYRGIDNIITIDLHNDYTVIAIIGKDENSNYNVQLMLKENSVSKWDTIEKAQNIDGVQEVSLTKTIGDEVTDIHSSLDRCGFVIAQCDSANDAIEVCEKAKKEIQITIG